MYTVLLIFQVLICVVLVGLVLIQKGQGADIGAVFGGGGSQTVFGAAGAGNFLSHVTAILAAIFFLNSLALAYLSEHEAHAAGVGIALPSSTAAAPAAAPASAPTASVATSVASGQSPVSASATSAVPEKSVATGNSSSSKP
ncbi:preprotein translocase subunit SecG [Acidithiobacillus sp. AMEEHan]|uniref:preprotein translocase subunit SecG n=1 Tax=Acidithiobacillus sp. AMEEHan TaxID=2994951 RepID=UPI0027E42BDD|nr:preprotein translocase subunit SecG [Acidithiobacillus sp. AMEEHan]